MLAATSDVAHITDTAIIVGGIIFLGMVIIVGILAAIREDKGHPIIPWSARMRVEKAKAHTDVMQQHLEQEALEIKRLALSHTRTQVMEAMESGDTETVHRLGLPAPKSHNSKSSRDYDYDYGDNV